MSKIVRARFSRRRFLRGLSHLALGSLVAGCAVARSDQRRIGEPEVRGVQLPPSQAVVSAQAQVDESELSSFLTLSALLTGVDDLDPALGQIYLQSLQANPESSGALGQLFEQAFGGSSTAAATLEDLESRGIFQNDGTRTVADKITQYWYTGVYEQEGEQVLATYVDALAWKTLFFTKPMSVCGSYRFWTEPPEAAID
jgi:hypothetical protein